MGNLQNIVPLSENQLSYANIVKYGRSIQKITDKVFTEAKIRSGKEMNVIISCLEPDILDEGSTLQSKVYGLISMIDNKTVIINSVKLFYSVRKKISLQIKSLSPFPLKMLGTT